MADKKKFFFLFFVFSTGLVIMAVELTASRILAPYFGTSIFVWGNVIGVVMIALSLGYYFGGKLADKRPDKKILMNFVLFSGIFISFIPFLVRPIAQNILPHGLSFHVFLLFGTFLTMLLLFSLPIFILGMASPFAIRILTKDIKQSGQIAGSVFAFSTLGSIVGTFLTTFLVIPFVGSRETLLLSSFILILIAVIGLGKKKAWLLVLLLIPVIVFWLVSSYPVSAATNLVYEDESPYNLVLVTENQGEYSLKFNEGWGTQSIYQPGKVLLAHYYDYYALLPFLVAKESQQVLMLGAGGGTIPRIYQKQLGNQFNFSLTSVDIDQAVIEAAKKYLDYPTDGLETVISDGRFFLQQTDQLYDIIIIDAYAQQLYIPWHLTTKEFFQDVKSHLTEQGIAAINVNAFDQQAKILRAIGQTMAEVFPQVYQGKIRYSGNYLLVAGQAKLDFQTATNNEYLDDLMSELRNQGTKITKGREILTDNRAPVELYTEENYNHKIYSR